MTDITEQDSIFERVARTSNIPRERLSATPPVPKSVKIEITGHCDFNCHFCAVSFKERSSGNIDESFLFRLLDEIEEAGVEEVGLFWMGEPFVNKKLARYIRRAKDVGIPYVFITTNGRLANEKRLSEVFDAGLDSIKFSINAPNQHEFQTVTGVDAYSQVIEHIKSAKSIRGNRPLPHIYASAVFDPNADEEYNQILNLVKPFVDQMYPLKLYGKTAPEKDGTRTNEQVKHARTLQSMLPCWSPFIEPHISFDGHMSACFCDFDPRLFMADLNKMSFVEGWSSLKFQELRHEHLRADVSGSPCETCIAYQ